MLLYLAELQGHDVSQDNFTMIFGQVGKTIAVTDPNYVNNEDFLFYTLVRHPFER